MTSDCRQQIKLYTTIKEERKTNEKVISCREATYRCLVLTSQSKPGVEPFETGMVPLSLLSLRSSHDNLDKLPIDGGIGPVKLLEVRDLRKS